MKALIAGILAGIVTWLVVGSIPNMLGNTGGWAALFVLIVGPFTAFIVGGFVWGHVESQESMRRAQIEEAERLRKAQIQAEEQLRKEHEALELRRDGLLAQSTSDAATLQGLTLDSERALNRAEVEFAEGAFAPFWDAVEKAANCLAAFNNTVEQINLNSGLYRTLSATLKRPASDFRIGITLPDARRTADRMRNIVRAAQKNFQFASIYEQRKTNQLLVKGFSSLGQAISDLGDRLDSSLQAYSFSVTDSISDLATAQRDGLNALVAEAVLSRENAADHASETRDHQRRELEMLDNLQHRRKP